MKKIILFVIVALALSHHRELSAIRENVTADEVKTLLLGMAFGQETLLAFFHAHNEKFDKRVGVNRRTGSGINKGGAPLDAPPVALSELVTT